MAVDHALLESVLSNTAPPTLRLYRWNRPSVTVGRFQNVVRTLKIGSHPGLETESQNVPVIRRITGGRGILHGDDLTLCLAAPITAIGLSASANAIAIYERVAEGLLLAFSQLGVKALMGECGHASVGELARRGTSTAGDCFDIVSRADIVEAATGIKLLGSALHRREDCFLQQISLPYQPDSAPSLRPSVFHSYRSNNKSPEYDEQGKRKHIDQRSSGSELLSSACQKGISEALNISWIPGSLTKQEIEDASHLSRIRYDQPLWNWHGK